MLAQTLAAGDISAFADGRVAGWSALAGEPGAAGGGGGAITCMARQWALADLALHLSARPEAGLARGLALEGGRERPARLPRALRPLAVLRGLTLRALRRGSCEVLDGPGAMIAALRIGLAGR